MWISEQTVTFALYVINRLVFIMEAENVFCAVRTDSLYNADKFFPQRVNLLPCFIVRSLCASGRCIKKHVNTPSDEKSVMLGRNMLRPNVNETLTFRMGILCDTPRDTGRILIAVNTLPSPLIIIIIVIIIIINVVSCHRPFLPGTFLEPAVISTAQASSFTLQYFPYYV